MNEFQKYPLTAASIDAISERVEQTLFQLKMERRNRLRAARLDDLRDASNLCRAQNGRRD